LEIREPILSLFYKDEDKFSIGQPVKVLMLDKGPQSNNGRTRLTSSVNTWACESIQEDDSSVKALCR